MEHEISMYLGVEIHTVRIPDSGLEGSGLGIIDALRDLLRNASKLPQ